MSVYDSIIVFDKGNVGEKIPMEIGISRIVMQPDSVPKINEGWVSFRTD
jgi:hypothetical protein